MVMNDTVELKLQERGDNLIKLYFVDHLENKERWQSR